MADDETKDDATPGDEPKPRKLRLTRRVLRQFGVRSGLQTGLNDAGDDGGDYTPPPPPPPSPPTDYGSGVLYRSTSTYYG